MRQALCQEPSYIFTCSPCPVRQVSLFPFHRCTSRLTGGKQLANGHGVGKRPSWDLHLICVIPNAMPVAISACCFLVSGLFPAQNICKEGAPKCLSTEWRRVNSYILLTLYQAMIWALYEHIHPNNSRRQVLLISPFYRSRRGGVERYYNLPKFL